jgi:hypothetical protein
MVEGWTTKRSPAFERISRRRGDALAKTSCAEVAVA